MIDSKGEISSTLPLNNTETNELGMLICNMLQDINSYMRGNNVTDLRKTTVRLGSGHEISIVMGGDGIKAVVKEVGDNLVGSGVRSDVV